MTSSLDQTYDAIQKVIFVGETGVGKTSLFTRYVDKTFTENKFQTIGVDFKVLIHKSNDVVVKLQIWDSAGG
jgi:GTPase SAR1 family protein